MSTDSTKTDWRELSEAASQEKDPEKLLELVEQLNDALELCEKSAKEKQRLPLTKLNLCEPSCT